MYLPLQPLLVLFLFVLGGYLGGIVRRATDASLTSRPIRADIHDRQIPGFRGFFSSDVLVRMFGKERIKLVAPTVIYNILRWRIPIATGVQQ